MQTARADGHKLVDQRWYGKAWNVWDSLSKLAERISLWEEMSSEEGNRSRLPRGEGILLSLEMFKREVALGDKV